MCAYDPTETYRKRSFRNIPHQVRLRKIEKILTRELRNRKVGSFLDIGCASGFITNRLKETLHIDCAYGTDAMEEYIENARKQYPAISFGVSDLNKPGVSTERFDLVTCFETMEHVGNLTNALDNFYASINSNGVALISVPIETGMIGTVKYLLKVNVYHDKMHEIGEDQQKEYFRTLISGKDISIYRQKKQKDLWWDHFGFNYRAIENYFKEKNIPFKGMTHFTTRFILVYKK